MKKTSKFFHITFVEEKFKEVFGKYIKDEKLVNKLFKQVVSAYSKKDRHYHNMHHLYAMVSLWDSYKHLLKNPYEIFFAIIYHDIVYNPKKKDNEFQSYWFYLNKIAVKDLLSGIKHDVVCKAILATKHDEESKKLWKNNQDIQYLLDFDLDVLGTRHKDTYEWYRKGVRKEYSIYPMKQYKIGRKAVLESFLKRKEIYLTPEFKMLEKRARKNLKNEIKSYLC